MSSVVPMLSGLFPEEGQVLDGFRAEAWAICDRVPEAVVFPESTEEVAAVLEMAKRYEWSVVPAGKGTWLYGGQPPARVDLVMSLNRMDRVKEYEPGDLTVTAEAGIGLDLLARKTRANDQWLPLDPPGLPRGTLGATIATDSAGSLEACYGRARDHLLGATLVRADGEILRLGGRVVKNVAGFDLLKLLPGSWGSLGIVTELTVRLYPTPDVDRVLLFATAGDQPLVSLATSLAMLHVPLAGLDILVPGEAERAGPGAVPLVVVRVMGSESVVEEITRVVRDEAPEPPERVLEGEEAARLLDNVQVVEEGAEFVLRMRALPTELPALLERAELLRPLVDPNRGFGMRLAAHARSGVLRVMVARLLRGEGWLEGLASTVLELRAAVEEMGGSLRLVQGPADLVAGVGSWGASGAEAVLVQGVKTSFDPTGVLAPGRVGVV